MHNRTRPFAASLALSASILAIAAPAQAQLDEIIVTAEKRAENLQDVPISIAAFDLEALETNRIEGLEDIGTFTPGVYVTQNPADPTGVRINIRGIGTFDPQVGQDSRVAIYQDGVYLGKTQGLAFDLPDMQRIEILKGPQGTLYGRNTVAGAVNLISAQPDPSGYSGRLLAEYGNFNHMKANGALNIPLGDAAAFRISGLYMERDGWVENNGPGSDFAGEDKYGVRAALGVEVSPDMRLDFAVDYSEVSKEPLFYQSFGPGAQPFSAAITPFDNGRQEEVTTSFAPEKGDSTNLGLSGILTWDRNDTDRLKITAAYREANSSRFVSLIPTANPQILNAITGGFNQALAPLPFAFAAGGQPGALRPDFASAFTGNPPERGLFLTQDGQLADTLDGHEQMSLEATYTGSAADGRLEYTLGAFYYDEETGNGTQPGNPTNANDYLFVLGAFNPLVTQSLPGVSQFLTNIGVPAAQQGPIPGSLALLAVLSNPNTPAGLRGQAFQNLQILNGFNLNFLASARQSAANDLSIETQALALYGQATYHLTDDFRITAGLRYSDESKDGIGQSKSPFFNDTIDLTGGTILPNISSYDDDILDPSITLEYDASDDVLLYASYKQSFRSGGFNAAAVGLRLPGETFGADFNFGREDITAYEAGFKAEFNNRIRLNGSAFYYDFTNKQTTVALNPIIATSRAVVNSDDEVYGFEIDGDFALTDSLSARAAYTFIDGDAGDVTNPLTGAVEVRDQLQGTPKNSLLAALDYNGTVGDKTVFGNLTYSYKDSVLLIPQNNLFLPSRNLVSGRIGMGFDMENGGQATLALWGQNLFDSEYLIDQLPFNTFAYNTKVYGQPRTYGVSLGYKF